MFSFHRSASTAVLLAALALGAAPVGAMAQTPPPAVLARPAAAMTPAQRDAAFAAIVAQLQARYVFPDKVPAIVAALNTARAGGRYDLDAPQAFAQRITEDLHAASGDGHLYLTYDPGQYAAATAAGAGSEDKAGADAYWRAMARREHHGLAEIRILPGNVRYLRISAFHWVDDETGGAYDDAARFLRDGDAVIVDLRGNGGGSDAAVRYAISHFMDSGQLLITFLEAGKPPVQSRTLDQLAAGRLKGKPLYVLIDGRVASAGEEFAYHVGQFKLGELVGEKTAGGANNNELTPIAPGFMLSVSYGRPVHPVSGGNWEGVGVAPTLAAERGKALDAAHALALTRLAADAGSTPEQQAEYAWAKVAVAARLDPPAVPAARLKAYAGRYGAARAEFRDGAVWLTTRENGPLRRLVPLTADGLFAIEGNEMMRAKFTATGLEAYVRGDPTPRTFPRSRS